ncbi:MAG TPA: hypothetical protein DC022_11235, partial [Alcanivorax sp.]|nr:hypothetical protein [Alcanivorax sp.]
MRHTALWQTLAGCALILAAVTSQATVYKIETTDDVAVSADRVIYTENDAPDFTPADSYYQVTAASSGGLCTLREAIYAISYQVSVGACEAGTGNDTIRLLEGETYLLTEGELPLGGRKIKFIDQTKEVLDPECTITAQNDCLVEIVVKVPVDLNEGDDTPISPSIRIDVFLDSFEEAEDKEKPVISAGGNSRLFLLERG